MRGVGRPASLEWVAVRRSAGLLGLLVAGGLALTAAGCAAEGDVGPMPSPRASAEPSPSVPSDGLLLEAYGFRNGPVTSFSLPRTARPAVVVDQPDNVTVVLTDPAPREVQAYLRRSLPGEGFVILADDAAQTTMVFRGRGWTGRFTGTDRTSAVLFRPG